MCLCSRRFNSIFLHANNLIRVVEREELLALFTAVLHASIILLILLADFRSHESGVHADVDSPQSVDAIRLVPSTNVTAFGNAAAGAHIGGCDVLAFLRANLADVPDLELVVPDGS